MDPLADARLAHAIAVEAGALLRGLRGARTGKAVGDEGDRAADDLIHARLRAARPGDCILSEETRDDRVRCSRARVWIIDPLDGTRDYAEGLDDWAVHVGLAIDGVAATGAVAVPMLDQVWATDDPPRPLPPLPARPRMVVSRTRCPALVAQVADAIGATRIGMGSAGAKAMAVVDGRADIYLHAGGQHQWDSCAPVAVALAAGLHASRIDGSPLLYNTVDTLLPDLLICRAELAAQVLAAVRAAT